MFRRIRPTRRALAAAFALAAGLVPPTAAEAARTPFVGVNFSRPHALDAAALNREFGEMRRAGVASVRLPLKWQLVQPQPGALDDWSTYDRIVGAAARARIRVLPTVVEAPVWARRFPDKVFSPPDPDAYGRFLGAAARRYGGRGAFWAQNPRLPRRPVTRWQVWNEPIGGDVDTASIYWEDPDPRPYAQYVAMLRAARGELRASDPRAKVVFAALFGFVWRTLPEFYAAGARGLFDELSVHPYADTARNAVRIVETTRRFLRRNGGARIPVAVTELCWASTLTGRFDGERDLLPERQRLGKLRAATVELFRRRRALGVSSVYWFTWVSDYRSPVYQFDYCGVRREQATGRVTSTRKLALLARLTRLRR